jgi:DNA-binding NarL/FixJ family response regulator
MLKEKAMTDQRIHMLMVGDHPGDLQLIQSLLNEALSVQFTWELVSNLSVATEILRAEPFDLVLLDLSLPNSQGLDTLNRLYPHAICLPIVILADARNDPLALQALQAGAQDYLVREQMEAESLVQVLDRAIERKRAETALRVKIRELTEAAEQLEQAIRIGDELNNLLLVVLLSLETLLAQIPSEDLKHKDLEAIHDQVSQMGRLVSNLLQLSQQSPSQHFKVDLPQEIKDTADLVQVLLDHKMITVKDDETYFSQTVKAGTAGYILKGASINELVATIYRVIREGVMIPHTGGPRSLNHFWEEIRTVGVPHYQQLSPREREIVRLIAKGRTNKEIAKRLSISIRTVERHRSSIMNKLGLQNRAELIAYAVQQGLMSGEDAK